MNTISIPCLVMASINFYVGAYYAFFYMKLPRFKEHLFFALLCISVGLYDLFSLGLYESPSLSAGIFWQRLQLADVDLISVFLIWFTMVITRKWKGRIFRLFIVWFSILLFAPFFVSTQYTLSVLSPAIKHVRIDSFVTITYNEGKVGLVYQAEIFSAIAAFIYLFYLLVNHYRETKRKSMLIVISCLASYFVAVANDSAVALQLYSFVYVSEYCFFFIVLSMAYGLFDDFVGVHAAFEKLNVTLEQKVEERTREVLEAQKQINTLSGLIPICSNCKNIRNDKGFWERLEKYVESHSDAQFSHGLCPDCAKKLYPEYFSEDDPTGSR